MPEPHENVIVRLWRGRIPLPDAFWNWAVGGGLVVNVITSAAFLILMMQDQVVAAILFGYGISIPYNLLATVGVWRAADRFEGDPRKAELARLATVTWMILLSVT